MIACGVLALMLAACAGPSTQPMVLNPQDVQREAQLQRELALDAIMEDEARIKRVAWPLLVAAAELCERQSKERVRFDTGATFTSGAGFGKELESTLRLRLNIRGHALVLSHVPPGTPAHSAGLRVGDQLVEIKGFVIPNTAEAATELAKRAHEWLKTGDALATTVARPLPSHGRGQTSTSEATASGTVSWQTLQFTVTPHKVCNDRAELVPREELNAFATGSVVALYRGMLRFASDAELSLVLGHEFAHNFMGHVQAMQRNQTLGTLADILLSRGRVNTQGAFTEAAVMNYSRDFEAEADYVGLYVAARAGIPIGDAPKFWRRMAVANPAGISPRGYSATHPATSERFVALERTVAEIETKRRDGKPLTPDFKAAK